MPAFRAAAFAEANTLEARLGLSDANATFTGRNLATFGRLVHRLQRGLTVRVHVVGGSAAAGAGGVGVNGTFDVLSVPMVS